MTGPPLTFNAWLRYGHIQHLLAELTDVKSILEVGPGLGAMGARLARRYRYEGVELDATSFRIAEPRVARVGGKVHLGDISAVGSDPAFDLVCAFEVLEHIEDDLGSLVEWGERLRPGGWLLLSVPAHQRRYGPVDRLAGHYRRYDPAELVRVLRAAGFDEIVMRTYGFPLGFALEAVRNAIAKRRLMRQSLAEATAASGRFLQPRTWMGWLTWLVTLPFRATQLPLSRTKLGTGFVVRARRMTFDSPTSEGRQTPRA